MLRRPAVLGTLLITSGFVFLQFACGSSTAASGASELQKPDLEGAWAVAVQSRRNDGIHRIRLTLHCEDNEIRGTWVPVNRPEIVNELKGKLVDGRIELDFVKSTSHISAVLEDGVLRGRYMRNADDPGLEFTAEKESD